MTSKSECNNEVTGPALRPMCPGCNREMPCRRPAIRSPMCSDRSSIFTIRVEIAVDDDAIEAVVYKTSRLSNSFANNSIGRLPGFCSATKSSVRRPVESKSADPGMTAKGRKSFQRERNRRFRSLWATARSEMHLTARRSHGVQNFKYLWLELYGVRARWPP